MREKNENEGAGGDAGNVSYMSSRRVNGDSVSSANLDALLAWYVLTHIVSSGEIMSTSSVSHRESGSAYSKIKRVVASSCRIEIQTLSPI